MSLGTKILIGMVIGLIIGLVLDASMAGNKEVATKITVVFQTVGDLFMRMLRMGVVPLIFFNIVYGIAQMDDAAGFGKVGVKLLIYYIATMLTATIFGLLAGFIVDPGLSVTVPAGATAPKPAVPPTVASAVLDFLPTNGLEAMATTKLLQVVMFAIFLGLAILQLPQEEKKRVCGWFSTLAKMMISLIMLVMNFAPYGIAALTAVSVAKFGSSVFGAMARFTVGAYLAMALQMALVYFTLLFVFAKIRPFEFLKRTMPIWMTSIATCSSQATLAVEMEVCQNKLGLPPKIVGFAQPLGATMNMDGNAMWMGILAVFTVQVYGLPLDFMELLKIVFLGTIMVMGSPGIPGGIFIASTIFLTAMGYPLEGIALLMGIFRIIDYGQTTMNILGDVVGTFIVSSMEKSFDRKTSPFWDGADCDPAPDTQGGAA
jgi:Na+/H+-dicarboxylate symporter